MCTPFTCNIPGVGGGVTSQSHFHHWIDYCGVAFFQESLEWGCTFSGYSGMQQFQNRKIYTTVSVHFRMTQLKGFIRKGVLGSIKKRKTALKITQNRKTAIDFDHNRTEYKTIITEDLYSSSVFKTLVQMSNVNDMWNIGTKR